MTTATHSPVPVLVIDDEADLREMLCELIECEGLQVVSATNGQEAWSLLEGGLRPQLILLDMWMPVMDGPTFLARLKSHPEFASIPVVIVSASTPAPGASAVLRKPFQPERLADVVHTFCAAA